MKYSLLFALFCISLSHGVWWLFGGWSDSGLSDKGTCTEQITRNQVTNTSDLLEKAEEQRLNSVVAGFCTKLDWFCSSMGNDENIPIKQIGISPKELGVLGTYASTEKMSEYVASGMIPVYEVFDNEDNGVFVIGNHPICIIVFRKNNKYFAYSLKSNDNVVPKTEAYEYIYQFGESLARFFLANDLDMRGIIDIAQQIRFTNSRINFDLLSGFSHHKDVVWLDRFGPHPDSPLICRSDLKRCIEGTETLNPLFANAHTFENIVFYPFKFGHNQNDAAIRLIPKEEYKLSLSGKPKGSLRNILSELSEQYKSIGIGFKNNTDHKYIGLISIDTQVPSSVENPDGSKSSTVGSILIKMLKQLGRPIWDLLDEHKMLPNIFRGQFNHLDFEYPPNSDS